MTAVHYPYNLTHKDVEEFTGYTYTDMQFNGAPMTQAQWEAFCTDYIAICAQTIHHYCNVPTYDPQDSEALLVEYRNGRGLSDDWDYPTNQAIQPQDTQYFLRNLYYTGTIESTSYAAVVVEEDTASKTSPTSWTTRTARSALVGGDYEVITTKDLTCINFNSNHIPMKGYYNVRFTYYTGYDPSSKPYNDIRFQILRVFKNLLLIKKNIQTTAQITGIGAKDYTGMFNQYSEGSLLSHMEESVLKRYRWFVHPGPMFD